MRPVIQIARTLFACRAVLATLGVAVAFAPSAAASAEPAPAQQEFGKAVELPAQGPLRITRNTRIAPGTYFRPPASGQQSDEGVIVCSQSGVTIDLRGVILRGAKVGTPLDKLTGFGVVLAGASDVTVIGGEISGYRGCVVATGCTNLKVEGIRFDGWFGQRLLSTVAAESEADWLWPHENDQGEWLSKYGGAISLTDCTAPVVKGCVGRHGQNGILLLRTNDARIEDNDFSFLSGWGLAMYRSSKNSVIANQFDYCVRGYSHGVYWRGQDSAAILMFERCSDNVIASNSATHSGDGLFLFAGRDSVDGKAFERGETEVGGSDRNLFFQNDFSYAVANGIEATFSRDNRALENLIRGCHQHGVWGGYSRGMVISGNTIEGTLGGGITIEHGQDCVLARNVLHKNEVGIELYWDEDPDLVGGPFGKRFDTASRNHLISGNSFAENDSDVRIERTTAVAFANNVFTNHGRELAWKGVTSADGAPAIDQALKERLLGLGPWLPSGRFTETSLALPPEEAPTSHTQSLEFRGPDVKPPPRPLDVSGLTLPAAGLDTIVMGEWGPWDFRSGEPRPAQRLPGGALAQAKWNAIWFSWKDGPDPRGARDAQLAWRALAESPIAEAEVPSWYTPWGGDDDVRRTVGNVRFGLIARTRVTVPPGRYKLEVVSDDGVRVSLDGRVVLENWTWHAPERNEAEVELTGDRPHDFVLEYFQIDGASALSVDLEPVRG